MSKPMILSSVITSTSMDLETDSVEGSDTESEVIYYTVRGKRRRKRDGDPDLFRKLCVWYGTIPAPEARSEMSEQVHALHEQDLIARNAGDLDWTDHTEETIPLVGLPLGEAEALA